MIPSNDYKLEPMMFEMRKCLRPGCGLRFPSQSTDPHRLRCPICRAETALMESFSPAENSSIQDRDGEPPELEVIVDNVRSKLNVGAIFRISDAAGVRCVHLCGITPTPSVDALTKTSLGAELSMPWEHHLDGAAAVKELREQGICLWALETSPDSTSIFAALEQPPVYPLGLVVGNEVTGIDPGILRCCDRVVNLPMHGIKESLNVASAYGIAIYTIRYHNRH